MKTEVIKVPDYPRPDILYTISDEEIKDGDLCLEVASFYPTGLPRVLKCIKRIGDEMIVDGGWTRRIKWPNKDSKIEMKKIISYEITN
jgi:hypothetical protein